MEYAYVLIVNHESYIVTLISDENSSGRYRMFDLSKNFIRREVYENRDEFEARLQRLCDSNVIDNWARVNFKVL